MSPGVIVRAPVRVSFGGGGTDLEAYYSRFGGFVVSAAISRYCYVMAREPGSRGISIHSADFAAWETYPKGEIPPVAEPLSLPKAAIERFAPRLRQRGVDLFLAAEVPPGTGLGSSSAMAVALVRALTTYTNTRLRTAAVAEVASKLEIERLGMPIGKQDQYASAFGGLNTLTFSPSGVEVRPLHLPPDVVAALSSRLLLFSTGESRHSAQILRQQRRDTGTKQHVTDSLHRIKELAQEMHLALLAQDLDYFGDLLDRSWQHKKRLGKVSSSRIDRCYAAACAAGARGGKITGAGGGGFLLLYCESKRKEVVREAMIALGLRELTFGFDFVGVDIISKIDQHRASIIPHPSLQYPSLLPDWPGNPIPTTEVRAERLPQKESDHAQ